MSDNIENSQGEIELGKLFALIGKGISNLFKGIVNIISKLLHYTTIVLIFLKKNAIYLGAALLIGGAIGYFLESKKPEKYSSDMILETNFGSGHQLYAQKKYINTLIDNENLTELSAIFNISKDEALALNKFKVEPYQVISNIAKEFDYFRQHTDTIVTSRMDIEEFKKRFDKPDYRMQKVTAFATNQRVFNKLNNGLVKLIENNHFKELLKLKDNEINSKKTILEKDLRQIDSLRKTYTKVALLSASSKSSSGTNINLEKQNSRNKDIDLFNQTSKILNTLTGVDREKVRNGFIVRVISEFKIGEKQGRILYRLWFRYAVLGFILTVLFLLSLKLNKYLNVYEQKLNS